MFLYRSLCKVKIINKKILNSLIHSLHLGLGTIVFLCSDAISIAFCQKIMYYLKVATISLGRICSLTHFKMSTVVGTQLLRMKVSQCT